MHNMRIIPSIGLLTLILLAGCRKYEQNGSLLHLRTPEARLVGTWTSALVEQVGTADTNTTDFMTTSNLLLSATFGKEGDVVITNVNEDIVYEGIWAFNDDKSVLHLDELTFSQVNGPFFRDPEGVDHTELVAMTLSYLQDACGEDLFFETGSYADRSEEVRNCYASLSATGTNWVLGNGTLNFNGEVYNAGDVINGALEEYITGFIDDELLDETCASDLTTECITAIIELAAQEYSAQIEYVEILEPIVTGWDDPNLFEALSEHCGLDVYRYEATPSGLDDPAVLGYIRDNAAADLDCNGNNETLGLELTSAFDTEVKVLDLYWDILELELDDMQAYQFREYDGTAIADYSFLLRFEKED